jgi:hypothetical protein
MSSFDVGDFVAQWDSAATVPVQVSKPRQVHCWTKTSKDEGGDICFGDTSGKHAEQSSMHCRICLAGPDEPIATAKAEEHVLLLC